MRLLVALQVGGDEDLFADLANFKCGHGFALGGRKAVQMLFVHQIEFLEVDKMNGLVCK